MAEYQGKRFKASGDGDGTHKSMPHAAARSSATDLPASHVPRGGASARPLGNHGAPTSASRGSAAVPPNPVPRVRGNHMKAASQDAAAPREQPRSITGGAKPPRPYRPSSYGSQAGRERDRAGRNAGNGDRGSARATRKGSGRDIISRVLIGIGIVLLLVAGGIFIFAQLGYRQAADTYEGLSAYVTVDDSNGDGIPVVDWAALAEESEDIVAWIYIPGTDISYPVVQGETNDQYLRALPDGTWNNSGSIMLDSDQTAPGMVGQQTTVYGHHMSDGSMFDPIEHTLDQASFDEMDTVYYLTPEATYRLTPLFTARVDDTYVAARQENFGEQATLRSYLEDLRTYAQAEAADADERIASADQVLALVTCSGVAPADHRAVMICTIAEAMSVIDDGAEA